ncbi:MAG TPA: glycosyltransferase [Thermoanaerobaculia bacterium]|nr:glycosyltransferase [Thermoanaerobaculia bacterium]
MRPSKPGERSSPGSEGGAATPPPAASDPEGGGRRRQRVCAIVPAYNEEATVTEAIRPVLACPLVDRVLVISDGSHDRTVEAASAAGAEVLELPRNGGKGAALLAGAKMTECDILLFSDADLTGLDRDLYRSLVAPVLDGERSMMVAVRDRGPLLNAIQRRWGPLLSGVRCLERRLLLATPSWALEGYRVETGLNQTARRQGATVGLIVMPRSVSHRVKEHKIGVGGGLRARAVMFAQVFTAYLRLRRIGPPDPHTDPSRLSSRRPEGVS